jgi:hypothetical protein
MTEAIPLVSVLIRSVGRPELTDALRSVAAQTYPNVEVLVIDALGEGHPAVAPSCGPFPARLCSTGRRLPRAVAANFALAQGGGKYLIFLDDDDYFDPDHIAALEAALHDTTPGCMVAYSGLRALDEAGAVFGEFSEPFSLPRLLERNFIQLSTALLDRRLVELGCRFDEMLPVFEDWDFWIQCARHTLFVHVDRVSVNYRAGLGTSGCGIGSNRNPEAVSPVARRITEKWSALRREVLAGLDTAVRKGQALYKAGEYLRARHVLAEVLKRDPENVNALNLLGMTELAEGNSSRAVELLSAAIAQKNDNAGLRFNLGLAMQAAGDLAGALTAYQDALTLDPNLVPARERILLLRKSSIRSLAHGPE